MALCRFGYMNEIMRILKAGGVLIGNLNLNEPSSPYGIYIVGTPSQTTFSNKHRDLNPVKLRL